MMRSPRCLKYLERMLSAAILLAPMASAAQLLATAAYLAWLVPRAHDLPVFSFYLSPEFVLPPIGMLHVAFLYSRASARGAAGVGLHAIFLASTLRCDAEREGVACGHDA